MSVTEKPKAEKRQIPAYVMPLITDWFNPQASQEGSVAWEIARLFSEKVQKHSRYKPDFSVGSEEDYRYRAKAVSCGQDIIREVLEESSVEELESRSRDQLSTEVEAVLSLEKALKSGKIKDNKFWRNDNINRMEFVEAQDQLFVGLDLLALVVAARYPIIFGDLQLRTRP